MLPKLLGKRAVVQPMDLLDFVIAFRLLKHVASSFKHRRVDKFFNHRIYLAQKPSLENSSRRVRNLNYGYVAEMLCSETARLTRMTATSSLLRL